MDWRSLRRIGDGYTSSIVDLEGDLLPGYFLFRYGNPYLPPALDLRAKGKTRGAAGITPCWLVPRNHGIQRRALLWPINQFNNMLSKCILVASLLVSTI